MMINQISKRQKEQLQSITPSTNGIVNYYPCEVTLRNGNRIDNVYLVEASSYLKTWGLMPDEDPGKKFVLIEEVDKLRDSRNRLQPAFANKLYKAGESGMGYCVFKLVFDNGQTLDVVSGNAIDFVPVPAGFTTNNIKDVLPHEGSRKEFIKGLSYNWCLYQD
jgi:hypothetical protein